MEKIGKTLKLLRVSHNLSQREVAKGVMDFSYYNRVENDKVNISYSKLVQLLRKMNISMEEFTFLQEKNQKNDNPHKLIAEAHYFEDINQLKYLRNLYNKKFEVSKNWSDRYAFILSTYILSLRLGKTFNKSYFSEVIEYLNSISYYTKDDILILINFYNLLPSEMIFYLFNKIFITKKKYCSFKMFNKNVMLFYFNVIDLAIREEKYSLAKKIFELTKKEFNNPLELLATIEFNYFEGLFLIITKQDIEKGIVMVEEAVNILAKYNLIYPAKYHKDTLELIKERIIQKPH